MVAPSASPTRKPSTHAPSTAEPTTAGPTANPTFLRGVPPVAQTGAALGLVGAMVVLVLLLLLLRKSVSRRAAALFLLLEAGLFAGAQSLALTNASGGGQVDLEAPALSSNLAYAAVVASVVVFAFGAAVATTLGTQAGAL